MHGATKKKLHIQSNIFNEKNISLLFISCIFRIFMIQFKFPLNSDVITDKAE